MPVAEFPMVSVSSSNPRPLNFYAVPEEFIVAKTIYDDGGADYMLQAGGIGVRRWYIIYDGMSLTEAAILDAHLATTFYSADEGSAMGFNFRDRDTGVLYANVHYESYERVAHTHVWSQARNIVLVKRP